MKTLLYSNSLLVSSLLGLCPILLQTEQRIMSSGFRFLSASLSDQGVLNSSTDSNATLTPGKYYVMFHHPFVVILDWPAFIQEPGVLSIIV